MKKILPLLISVAMLLVFLTVAVYARPLNNNDWEIGSLASKDGQLKSATNRIYTPPYYKAATCVISYTGGLDYMYIVMSYNKDYKYLGTSDWILTATYTTSFAGTEYYRFIIKFSDERTITFDNMTQIMAVLSVDVAETAVEKPETTNPETTAAATAADVTTAAVTTAMVTTPTVTTAKVTTAAVTTTKTTTAAATTAKVTEPAVTTAPESTAATENNGCSSAFIGIGAIVTVLGAAIVIKKSKN